MKFLTDNLELVKRSQAHLEYTLPYSNTTLSSEYDVTEQIFLLHQTDGINASFHHVYGHQDNKIEYTDLPIEAKLNCDTDQLAGEYQDRYGSYRPVARLLPSCPAVINIRGLTITSNLRHQPQRAYLEPQYIGHLHHKKQMVKHNNIIISLEMSRASNQKDLERRPVIKNMQRFATDSSKSEKTKIPSLCLVLHTKEETNNCIFILLLLLHQVIVADE